MTDLKVSAAMATAMEAYDDDFLNSMIGAERITYQDEAETLLRFMGEAGLVVTLKED